MGGAPHQATAECRPPAPAQCPASSAWSLQCPQRSVLVWSGSVLRGTRITQHAIRYAKQGGDQLEQRGLAASPQPCPWHAPLLGIYSLLPTGSRAQMFTLSQAHLKAPITHIDMWSAKRGCQVFRLSPGTPSSHLGLLFSPEHFLLCLCCPLGLRTTWDS